MKKRILLVDDEPHNLEILRIYLKSLNYDILEAECGKDALRMVNELSPDVILLDVMMPDLSGFAVVEQLKGNPEFRTPIIFLSAKVQKEDILQGLQLGAFDYLTKPFDLDLLEKKLEIVLDYHHKLRQLKEENVLLGTMTYIDSLTGLYNRAYLNDVIELIKEGGTQYEVAMMIDIDHFKDVNDNFGHLLGDAVLKEVSKILNHNIDVSQDLAFRYGGDEFLLLIKSGVNHLEVAEAILADVDALSIQSGFDRMIHVTVSIGLSNIQRDIQLEKIISHADKALYGAKHSGRNRLFIC